MRMRTTKVADPAAAADDDSVSLSSLTPLRYFSLYRLLQLMLLQQVRQCLAGVRIGDCATNMQFQLALARYTGDGKRPFIAVA